MTMATECLLAIRISGRCGTGLTDDCCWHGEPVLHTTRSNRGNGKMNIQSETAQPARCQEPRREFPAQVGAVVIGGDYQGLGIVRSLGRRGVPVCIIDDENSIARFSRYATHALRVKELRDQQACVETLLRVGREMSLQGWVLYPTREETVAALARNREELSQHFRVPTPSWNTIEKAWDKRCSYKTAQELGIPTPRTWACHDASDLERIEGDPPFAVKPAIKEHFFYATKAKAWRANSRAELRDLFNLANQHIACEEVLVQELIPGDGSKQFGYCAFFKGGQAVASMVVQRVRQHPPEFGRASTYVQTVDLPVLESLSERFLRGINYYGLVEVEYKLDDRTQEFKLLDVNARTWGYHSLGAAAGVDFPYLLFADQVGSPVEHCRARVGVRWVRMTTDIPTALVEIANRRLTIAEYIKSVRGASVDGVFCREDMKPGLAEISLLPYMFLKRGF
jgi:D-aspartate ligase